MLRLAATLTLLFAETARGWPWQIDKKSDVSTTVTKPPSGMAKENSLHRSLHKHAFAQTERQQASSSNCGERREYVDVGANDGQSLEAVIALSPRAYTGYVAFEFNPAFGSTLNDQLSKLPGGTLVPAAAWVSEGEIEVKLQTPATGQQRATTRGVVQNMTGSSIVTGGKALNHNSLCAKAKWCSGGVVLKKVPAVDFASWLRTRYCKADFVFVKMDIEGAEFDVMEHVIKSGAVGLIDQIALEWHAHKYPMPEKEKLNKRRAAIEANLTAAGVKMIDWDQFYDSGRWRVSPFPEVEQFNLRHINKRCDFELPDSVPIHERKMNARVAKTVRDDFAKLHVTRYTVYWNIASWLALRDAQGRPLGGEVLELSGASILRKYLTMPGTRFTRGDYPKVDVATLHLSYPPSSFDVVLLDFVLEHGACARYPCTDGVSQMFTAALCVYRTRSCQSLSCHPAMPPCAQAWWATHRYRSWRSVPIPLGTMGLQ